MTTLADAKLTSLEALTGNTGHVNDLEAEFLVLLGATAGSAIVDQWWEVFDAAAVPPGQFNDRAVAYIVATVGVPPSNDYNEHWRFYWENVTVGPVVPVPPLLADLLHWFDFADQTQLFQDAAGVVPIVPGQDVIRVNNKGTDGTPLIDAFPPGPIWTLDLVNGLAGVKHTANFTPIQQAGWLGAGGASGQMNFGWGRREALGPSTGVFWQQSGGGGDDQLRADDAALPAEWGVAISGIPTPTSTNKALVLDEWNWVYGGVDNTLNQIWRAGGVVEQSGGGVYSPPGAPSTAGLGIPQGELIEVLVYGRGLTPAEVLLVIAYMDARAGKVMPFIEPPTTVSDLIHHYDLTDNTTVFRNTAGTQLATEGDPIRLLRDKGSQVADLQSAGGGDQAPVYRENFVGGENVAEFFASATSRSLLGTDGPGHSASTKGISAALVFQITQAIGGAVTVAAWGSAPNGFRGGREFGAGQFGWDFPGATSVFSLTPHLIDGWYLWYESRPAGIGTAFWQKSGEAQQSALLGVMLDILAGQSIGFTHITSQTFRIGEWAVWDGPLSAAELAALVAFADEKYGTLPIVPLLPPFLPNLTHWWDFTDAATVFADISGTIAITDGTTIARVDDKGVAADDLLDAGSGITWHAGVVNGLAVARNTVVQPASRFTSQALATLIGGGGGFTYSSVKRHFNVPGGQGIMHAIDNGPSEVTQESGFGSWAEDHPNQGTTFSNKAVVVNEWVEHSVSDGGPSGYIQHVSGAVDVTAINNFAIQTGTPVEIFAQSVDGEIGEILVYDRGLSAAELLVLQAYYDTKYLALPHL